MINAENNTYTYNKSLQILNFYSDNCPPCHAFMPNFIEAEKTFWEYYDFIKVDAMVNRELIKKFWVRATPTIAIIKNNILVHLQAWVPNWMELKNLMKKMIWEVKIKINEKNNTFTKNEDKVNHEARESELGKKVEKKERKKFLWIF